ncbi:MAG: anaerobic ribonucleoside-triphosphate reductase activating protein [Nanoarchaeota archaeon]|nr:anaerobic ribonucleoside-triphosphate reductase activating protein [Nanoarchaeota archaeon]
MNIAGIIKNSFIDFPGEISAVVFTQGCNMSCPYCHNPELNPIKKGSVSEKEVLEFLRNRKKYLSGVVLTGGEPTLQKNLIPFLKKIKSLGFKVKLDTNGTNPRILKKILKEKVLDYLAMDVKTCFDKYHLSGANRVENIKKSMQIIKDSGLKYEFRTTFVPGIVSAEDVPKMCEMIKGTEKYVMQQFEPNKTLNQEFSKVKPYPKKVLDEFKKVFENHADEVLLIGF